MASVKVHHNVQVGGRVFKLRTRKPFIGTLAESQMTATIPQMRNVAWETRDLLIDKALAGSAQGRPTVLTRGDFPRSKAKGRRAPRQPYPFDRDRRLRLQEDYVDWKVREGYDPRPLLARGDYFRAIVVFESRTKKGVTFEVRLKRGRSKRTGIPFSVLWRWLEFGNSRTKPRPHWRPAARIVAQIVKRIPENARVQAVRDALRSIQ